MKRYLTFLVVLSVALIGIGCGGSTPNPEAAAEAEKVNTDPDYEKEMMGGGTDEK
jgi:hypothetical protein